VDLAAGPVLDVLDLAGVVVFAASGALLAIRRGFDLIGLITLAAVTALGGGILRDLVINAGVPFAFREARYPITALITAVLVLPTQTWFDRLRRPVLVLDAAGLGLFSATGAVIASEAGLGAVAAVTLGVTTATGGGVARDVLAGEAPQVFRPDSVLYVIPATVGAIIVVVGHGIDLSMSVVGTVGAALATAIRLAALRFGWRASLPRRWQ
jgi:uncharacterized membrane protein YeiH